MHLSLQREREIPIQAIFSILYFQQFIGKLFPQYSLLSTHLRPPDVYLKSNPNQWRLVLKMTNELELSFNIIFLKMMLQLYDSQRSHSFGGSLTCTLKLLQ